MNAQFKYTYKKSREQFMQQLRAIRKQLKQKIDNIDRSYEDGHAVVSMREDYSPSYREQALGNRIHIQNGNFKRMLKGNLEQAGQLRVNQVHTANPQKKMKPKQSQISSYRKLKINKHKSLGSKSKFSRARLIELPQASFEPFFLKISKNRQNRSNLQLAPALSHLQQFNKLFYLLDEYLCLCLLKIGFYHELNPHEALYGMNYDKSSIYIILSGVISLLNPNIGLKKLLFTGETLGQQMLFSSEPMRSHLQLAKAVKKTYVIELRTSDYLGLSEQLAKFKSYKAFSQFQEILRDGFTQKNIARNEHLLNRKIRMKSNY